MTVRLLAVAAALAAPQDPRAEISASCNGEGAEVCLIQLKKESPPFWSPLDAIAAELAAGRSNLRFF